MNAFLLNKTELPNALYILNFIWLNFFTVVWCISTLWKVQK